MVLFGLLMLNANWVQVVKADAYRDDPRNSRVLLRTYERERGAIAVVQPDGSGRTAVAESSRTDGPLTWLRGYPGGAPYAHATGYFSLVYGRTGLERSEDEVLSGEDDRFFVRRLSDSITGREPQGGNIITTLDAAAQEAAYDALGDNRGAVVALDPRTGAVLAMVSKPSFDPARLSSFEPADIRAYYAQLNEDSSDPLLNRTISRTYPPGSTFKVVTAAAALSSGDVTTETQIPSPRELDLPQTTANLRNFGGSSCGAETITLGEALRISCNTSFGSLGLSLGAERLREQAEAFGFGDDSFFDELSMVPSQAVGSDRSLDAPQTALTGIGQLDVATTPLQMALVGAGIANQGTVMKPYLVEEVRSPDLTPIEEAVPEELSEAITPEVADELTTMMEAVVTEGTAESAAIPDVAVAAKTGTAQTQEENKPYAWFVSFAPADDPRIAVAVFVQDASGVARDDVAGGALAGPIAKSMMEAALR
jgi:peptidoglycan glycosyltransferase